MFSSAAGHFVRSVGQLPGDKDPPLAAYLHAIKSLVETGDQPSHPLRERHWLRRSELGLSVGTHDWLVVRSHNRNTRVVKGRIELDAVGGAVSGVLHFEQFARHKLGTRANFVVLIAQAECRLHNAVHDRDIGRQFACGRRRCGRFMRGGGRRGRGLGKCGNRGRGKE